jgi:hypothetical protein
MSVLFTAVSVEQQEIVAGGLIIVDNSQSNGVYLEINKSDKNNVTITQRNKKTISAPKGRR